MDPATGRTVFSVQDDLKQVWDNRFSPDGNYLAVGYRNGSRRTWSLPNPKRRLRASSVTAIQFRVWRLVRQPGSGHGQLGRNGEVVGHSKSRALGQFRGRQLGFHAVAISRRTASGSRDGEGLIMLWDIPSRQEVFTLKGHDTSFMN